MKKNITLTAVWTPHEVLVYAIPSVTYNGEPQIPTVKVVDDVSKETLKAGKDYTFTFENNVKAGEAKAVISFIDDYVGVGQQTKSFTINRATVTVTGLSATDKVYDGNDTATVVGNPVLSGVFGDDDVQLGEAMATFVNQYAQDNKNVRFTVKLTGADVANYQLTRPENVQASILPREVGLIWTDTEFTYDGQPHAPTATLTNLVEGDVVEVTVAGEQTMSGSHTATATELTGRDAENYALPEDATQAFTIKAAEPGLNVQPTEVPGLTYTGQPQELVTAGSAENGTMQYSADGENWSETVPTGTGAGDYTVYYRVKGDDGYADTEPRSLTATIAKAALTVMAKDNTITYGDEPANKGVVFEGFVNNESQDDLDLQL